MICRRVSKPPSASNSAPSSAGALTRAEWEAAPDSAAAVNVVRGASREVLQRQYSVGWRWRNPFRDVGERRAVARRD